MVSVDPVAVYLLHWDWNINYLNILHLPVLKRLANKTSKETDFRSDQTEDFPRYMTHVINAFHMNSIGSCRLFVVLRNNPIHTLENIRNVHLLKQHKKLKEWKPRKSSQTQTIHFCSNTLLSGQTATKTGVYVYK